MTELGQGGLSEVWTGTPVEDPSLSIVIFTRNDADHLRACLQSLVGSPPSGSYEVIVFENASEDVSQDVLESFRGRLPLGWIAAQEETSFSEGNNRGLAVCRGEFVVFLNPDTLPLAEVLDGCRDALRSDPTIGLVSPRLIYPDGSPQETGWELPRPGHLLREHLLGWSRVRRRDASGRTEVGWLMGCFLMGRRVHLLSLNGFDEAFWFHGTDLEFCARVGASGRSVVRLEGQRMVHVGHRRWDKERRRASHAALTQWIARDCGRGAARGVGALARVTEALRP